jgi:DDE superfamily endonuclease
VVCRCLPAAPRSLAGLLAEFRPCFTAPTFHTFIGLVVGLIAQTRRRTVCGMLTGVGLDRVWHHSRAHRLFSHARWSGDALGLALADLIVARLLPAEAALTIAVDDTLFKRSGKKVFGVAWHHDGAAKGPKPIGFGNCWVVAGIVVQLPFLSHPVCLPVLARLWRPRHTGKIAHARQLAELITVRYPDRAVHVVGDAASVGEHLRDLDGRITWTSRLRSPRCSTNCRHRAPGAPAGHAPAAPGWAPRPTLHHGARGRRRSPGFRLPVVDPQSVDVAHPGWFWATVDAQPRGHRRPGHLRGAASVHPPPPEVLDQCVAGPRHAGGRDVDHDDTVGIGGGREPG